MDVFGHFGKAPPYPEQQVDAVGVVVAADQFLGAPFLQGTEGVFEKKLHGAPRGSEYGVRSAVVVAPPGIVEVGEVKALDVLGFQEVENVRQLGGIVAGHGEAQAHLEAALAAQADALHGRLEGAGAPAEPVMGLAEPVDADAHVVVADGGDLADGGGVDEGAVGGKADVEPHVLGAPGYLEDVGAQQRLAAGQDEGRHPERLEVVENGEHLVRGKLAREILVGRDRIAMLAGQVAAPDQVPDDHRAWRAAARARRRRGVQLADELGNSEHRPFPHAARRKPVFLRMRVL